jgi:two-component system, NarL family, response regulator NreC
MREMPASKVVIVEDHPIFSKGLRQLINAHDGYSVLGEAADCAGAKRLVGETGPDLVIVDLNLGNEDGLELIKDLKSAYPDLAMLVLSMHDERYYAERVIRAGARGYVMKEEVGAKVVEAMSAVLDGKVWLSDVERDRLFRSISGDDGSDEARNGSQLLGRLTDRQLQIVNLIAKGLGTVEIAARLNLSEKTVGTHKEHIKKKLNCASGAELRQLAIKLAGK